MLDTAKLGEIISAIKLRNGTAIGPPKKIVLTKSDDEIEATSELRHQLFSQIQLEDGPLKSPCWIFLGIHNTAGYGSLLRNGEFIAAHRLSYQLHHGPIPDGLWVLHACDQPSCCAPDHLLACARFRRHRVRCFDGAGGGSWRDGSLRASSSLRLCG